MSSSVTVLRRRSRLRGYPRAARRDLAEAWDRSVRRRVNAAWGLLYFNTLTFIPGLSVLHLPSKVGKGIAQIALPLAILVALSINPKIRLRPNVFLCIASLLVLDTVITATQAHLGNAFRTFRLAEFVCALWLLTPWWGRRDMLLFWCHLRWLVVALGSVLLGLLVSPGRAFSYDGRLTGAIWPMVPTQVAQYTAIATGLMVALWLGRQLSGRVTLAGVTVATALLLLTHTRTALIAMVAGLLVAGLSLFLNNARVRRFFAAGAAVVAIGVMTAAGFITAWLARGQTAQGLTTLTGRTNFWALVLDQPRTKFQEIFGFGLSNASVNGLPIDSNWLASYMQEGLFGVVVCALMVVWLFTAVWFQSPGLRRALALFILTYCLLASFTEDAFTDASTYLLNLVIAASLFVVPVLGRHEEGGPELDGAEIRPGA
jgi:small basic protein